MLDECFSTISVGSIENVLDRMLSDFLNMEFDSQNLSGFSVTQFRFAGRDTEHYPVTFKVHLKSSGDFKEFSLPPSKIVDCLGEFFASIDGAENMRFRTARVNYEYPQYEGDAEISMYCLLENTLRVTEERTSSTLIQSSNMGW